MNAFEDLETMDDASPTSDSGAATADRRRAPRFTPARRLTVQCTEGVMSVFGWGEPHLAPAVLDLSSGGARLATKESLRPGTVVRLDIGTEGVEGIEAFGEVRWTRPGGPGHDQFLSGVEFFTLPPLKYKEMNNFLELLRRPADGFLPA